MYRIMIVDDERAIRDNLPKVIPWEAHGFTVAATAKNGHEALDRLLEMPIDLVLLDVRMPVMDGLAFLKALRESPRADTQVVMLSGYSDFSYAREAMRYEVKAYLTKPIDEDELFAVLKQAREKLDGQCHARSLLTLQKDVKMLRDAMDGALLDTARYGGYFLLTAVMLPFSHSADAASPSGVMRRLMADILGDEGLGLVWMRGYANLFLISREALRIHGHDERALACAILRRFMDAKIDCAVLFDHQALSCENFAAAYKRHLHLMETTLFYDMRHHLSFGPAITPQGEGPEMDTEALSLALNDTDPKRFESWFDALLEAMKRCRAAYRSLQEITDRIYYTIADALKSGADTVSADKTVIREEMYFLRLPVWAARMRQILSLAHRDMLARRQMQGMGVTGDIVTFIRAHYTEPITIKQVAEKFFLNPVYLGQVFHKTTGLSFKQYVTDLRIKAARQLLIETDLKIYEVAQRVGYAESKYFIVKFEEAEGVTPSEFRKRL